QSPIAEEFRRFNTRASLTLHPQAPDVPVMPAYIADSFLHARDTLFPDDPTIRLDRKQLTVNCVREGHFSDEQDWQHFRATLRRSLTDDAELVAWFDREYGERPLAALDLTRWRLKRYNGSCFYLDASDFGVTNVFEAAQFCEKLLGCKRDG